MAPFMSKSQMAYLWSKHPEVAKKWAEEYKGKDWSKLPEKVKKKK